MAQKQQLVKTDQRRADEAYNEEVVRRVLMVTVNGMPSRPELYRLIRILHETVNELTVELYCANPQHVIFDQLPQDKQGELLAEKMLRVNGKHPRGKVTRIGLNF